MAMRPMLHQNNLLLTNFSSSKPSLNPPPHFFSSNSLVNSFSSSLSLLSRPLSPPCIRISARVSTAPAEFAPPAPEFDFHLEIARLKALRSKLSNSSTSIHQKVEVIDSDSRVRLLFCKNSSGKNRFVRFLESLKLDDYQVYLLKCVVAAGQEHVLFDAGEFESAASSSSSASALKSALYALAEMIEKWDAKFESSSKVEVGLGYGEGDVKALRLLLKTLGEVEQFYDCIGGIIGYQIMALELLAQSTNEGQAVNWSQHTKKSLPCQFIEIHPPKVLDLSQGTEYASQAALWGIEGLPDLGEIYPLGGSGDRLGLVDSNTGECLPAAMLPYCGRTLLEGLIRDLQGREFLFFKLYGKQCITPVAIMTSSAKKNHERMASLGERLEWFGRGRLNFQLFEQPLVPTINAEDGRWIISRQFMPVCKPGGHGVIWKLAYDKGVFQWFRNHGRKGATVRQASNVVAATDLMMLALAGIGLRQRKFHGGSISVGSELQVEVVEFLWRDVQLHGSLIILAENVMGSTVINDNGESILQYGNRCGRCKLENVKVLNKGINWHSGDNSYWKHDVDRIEAVKVILHGNAEFEAVDVTLQGDHLFEVPDGYRMRVTSGKSGLEVQQNAIEEKLMESGSWFWRYKIEGTHIQLELVEL